MEAQRRHLVRMVHTLHRHESQALKAADRRRLEVLDRAESEQLKREAAMADKQRKKQCQAEECLKEARSTQHEELKKHASNWDTQMRLAHTRVMNGLMEHHQKMEHIRDQREKQSIAWEKEKRRRAEEREQKRQQHERDLQQRLERITEENERKERERDLLNHQRIADQNRRLAQTRQDKYDRAQRAEQKRLRFARRYSDIMSFENRSQKFAERTQEKEAKVREQLEEKRERERDRTNRVMKRHREVENRYNNVLDTMFQEYDAAELRRDQRERFIAKQKASDAEHRAAKQLQRERDRQKHREQYMRHDLDRLQNIEQKNLDRWTRHAESFSRGAEEFSRLLTQKQQQQLARTPDASPPPSGRQAAQGAAPTGSAAAGTGTK